MPLSLELLFQQCDACASDLSDTRQVVGEPGICFGKCLHGGHPSNLSCVYTICAWTRKTVVFVSQLTSKYPPGLMDPAVRQSASKILWLAIYRLSALFDDIENFLCRLKITQDRPPQWWLNFAQKSRFGHSQTFVDLIQRSDFHIWAFHTTTRTFNGYMIPSWYSFCLLIVPVYIWAECSKRIVYG